MSTDYLNSAGCPSALGSRKYTRSRLAYTDPSDIYVFRLNAMVVLATCFHMSVPLLRSGSCHHLKPAAHCSLRSCASVILRLFANAHWRRYVRYVWFTRHLLECASSESLRTSMQRYMTGMMYLISPIVWLAMKTHSPPDLQIHRLVIETYALILPLLRRDRRKNKAPLTNRGRWHQCSAWRPRKCAKMRMVLAGSM